MNLLLITDFGVVNLEYFLAFDVGSSAELVLRLLLDAEPQRALAP